VKAFVLSVLFLACLPMLLAGACPYPTYQNLHCSSNGCDQWVAISVCNGSPNNPNKCGATDKVSCCSQSLVDYGTQGQSCNAALVPGAVPRCDAPLDTKKLPSGAAASLVTRAPAPEAERATQAAASEVQPSTAPVPAR
jgi:hypothetical protein